MYLTLVLFLFVLSKRESCIATLHFALALLSIVPIVELNYLPPLEYWRSCGRIFDAAKFISLEVSLLTSSSNHSPPHTATRLLAAAKRTRVGMPWSWCQELTAPFSR